MAVMVNCILMDLGLVRWFGGCERGAGVWKIGDC